MLCVVDVLFTTNFSNKPFALVLRSFITFSPTYDVGFDKYFQRHFPLVLYFICRTAGVTRLGFASRYWWNEFFQISSLDSQGAPLVYFFLQGETVWSQVNLKTCKEPEGPQTWPSLPGLESMAATYRNVNVLIEAKCLRKRESVLTEYDKRKERCLSKECRQRNMSENKEIIVKHVCVSFILYFASSHLTRPYGYINYRSKVWYKECLKEA